MEGRQWRIGACYADVNVLSECLATLSMNGAENIAYRFCAGWRMTEPLGLWPPRPTKCSNKVSLIYDGSSYHFMSITIERTFDFCAATGLKSPLG